MLQQLTGSSLPGLWEEIANLIGQQQTELIYWIFQGFFIVVIITWFIVTCYFLMVHAIKYFNVKEEAERKSFWKSAKAPIISGLILVGAIVFLEVGWNIIAPIIWKAVS